MNSGDVTNPEQRIDVSTVLEKTCRRCAVDKPAEMFGNRKSSPDGIHVYCRECMSFLNKEARLVKLGLLMRVPKRFPDEKICPQCGILKSVEAFHLSYRGSGRGSWCSPCWIEYNKVRLASNPEALAQKRASSSAWQKANPEAMAAAHKRYRAKHPEKVIATKASWVSANSEVAKQHRAKRRAMLRNAKVISFTPAQLSNRMAYYGNRCWMCKGPFEHVDHVKPISKGGTHMLANLRPSCGHCNNVKHAQWFGPNELQRFMTP